MKKVIRIIMMAVWGTCVPSLCFAIGIAVTNVELVDKDTGNDTIDIQCDVSWDYSWRLDGAPSQTANWDAAWIFAKYSTYSGGTWSDWGHCTLLNTGSVAAAGSTITFSQTGSVYMGAFVYRSSAGSGSNSFTDMEVRWDYGADGVADGDTVKVEVHAIEMVYIPEGAFYVGDPDSNLYGNLKLADGTIGAVQITSSLSAAINCGNTSNDDTQLEGDGIRIDGDGGLDTDADGVIDNANFPTGYNAFYLMKYEISQGQYAAFLNSLTTTQATNRFPDKYGNARYFIKQSGDGRYGCDANNNAGTSGSADYNSFNESDDGEWTACNYLSWTDLAAYADWAGLRPMTELEFEKACRGGQAAVTSEYAWGSTSITRADDISNDYQVNESPSNAAANACYDRDNQVPGPLRGDCFGSASSTRVEAGAGYDGCRELSGNVRERCITIGRSTGRSFEGTHGDGSLDASGNATNADWPDTTASGVGECGGSWRDNETFLCVAYRGYASTVSTIRDYYKGGRCARTP